MTTYRCCACRQEKAESQFHRARGAPRGRQGRCKDCRKEQRRAHWEARGTTQYARAERERLVACVTRARARARERALVFELDSEWVVHRFADQKGKCALTGVPLEFTNQRKGHRGSYPRSPSLDRINPDRGYTRTNTRLVCTAVNLATNRFGRPFGVWLRGTWSTSEMRTGFNCSRRPGLSVEPLLLGPGP